MNVLKVFFGLSRSFNAQHTQLVNYLQMDFTKWQSEFYCEIRSKKIMQIPWQTSNWYQMT